MSQSLAVEHGGARLDMGDWNYHREAASRLQELKDQLQPHKPQQREPNRKSMKLTSSAKSSPCTTPCTPSAAHQKQNFPATSDFLLREESHGFEDEDALLFSVEQDELQPITSPFMVPGIYRKISTAVVTSTTAFKAATRNVFTSEKECHGRIVSADDFKKLYICISGGVDESAGARPRKCVLLKRREKAIGDRNVPRATACDAQPINANDNWDALSKLAQNILKLSQQDHIVIDRQRNEIVRTENGTNQKTIYRVLAPENLGLRQKPPPKQKPPALNANPIRLKLGRPRKMPKTEADAEPERKTVPNPSESVKEDRGVETAKDPAEKEHRMRTRFGRIVRLVNPLGPHANTSREANGSDMLKSKAPAILSLVKELRDADFHCSKIEKALHAPKENTSENRDVQSTEKIAAQERRIPPEAFCPTCGKIFLGRRLQRHFAHHPDHLKITPTVPPTTLSHTPADSTISQNNKSPGQNQPTETATPTEEMTLFRFLIAKLQKSHLNDDQRADLFLNELNDFVKQLQLRSSRLIRNTSGLHFVTGRIARVLSIPEGHYALDMNAIEAPPEPEVHATLSTFPTPTVNGRNLDYTQLSMSMDNTITDEVAQKLNLSAGGKLLPPSEETLLRVVDDLVHDGIKDALDGDCTPSMPTVGVQRPTSNTATLMPHYDHVNDNAVEAVHMKETTTAAMRECVEAPAILDLPVDFFQFGNNN